MSGFPARIEVTAINEPGTLAQIAQVIADSDGNISNLRIDQARAGLLGHGRSTSRSST